MDLGIAGRTAIVCASSRGLGNACAWSLARAGCNIVVNGRDEATLGEVAAAIRQATGVKVDVVAADLNSEQGIDQLLSAAPEPDILVNNNGGPPLRDFRELDAEALHAGLTSNMITPIRLIQRVIDGMTERGFGRIVCITSATVKRATPKLELSTGARIGLTGFLGSVARSVAHANVTINFILPGSFETNRLRSVMEDNARQEGVPVEMLMERAASMLPAGRFGQPDEFGAACAFLCSAQAGYITGQSLLLDGGAYPGIF
jgi:3-oxoacyl-[acyl-carrier protein] reductase